MIKVLFVCLGNICRLAIHPTVDRIPHFLYNAQIFKIHQKAIAFFLVSCQFSQG